MRLTDGRVGLRPFVPDDAPTHAAAILESLDDLRPWLPLGHAGWTVRDSEAFITRRLAGWQAGGERTFAVELDGRFVGDVSLENPDRPMSRTTIGWWTRSAAKGQGVATAAARLAVRHALADLGFNRVEIYVAVGNLASVRVAEKLGAVREGLLRERLVLRGETQDAWLYSVLLRDVAPAVQGG